MSQLQYIQVALDCEELVAALAKRQIYPLVPAPGRRQLLPVSANCVPESVDLAFAAGTAHTLEAWGLRKEGRTLVLVCGEFDRKVLTQGLLQPIQRAIVAGQVAKELRHQDAQLEVTHTRQDTHETVIEIREHDDDAGD